MHIYGEAFGAAQIFFYYSLAFKVSIEMVETKL